MGETLGVAAGLVRLSFLVQCVYARSAAAYDLPVAQAQLLCVLKDRPRGMTELSGILHVEKSSLSGLVDRVERRGLLRRTSSLPDRRAVIVELTGRGKAVADAFYDETSEQLLEVVTGLSAADLDHFTRIATRIVLDESVPAIFGDSAGTGVAG